MTWTFAEIVERIEKRIARGERFDAHIAVAAELFGVPEDKVTKEMRDFAKSRSYLHWYSAPGPLKAPFRNPFVRRTDR